MIVTLWYETASSPLIRMAATTVFRAIMSFRAAARPRASSRMATPAVPRFGRKCLQAEAFAITWLDVDRRYDLPDRRHLHRIVQPPVRPGPAGCDGECLLSPDGHDRPRSPVDPHRHRQGTPFLFGARPHPHFPRTLSGLRRHSPS